MAEKSRGSSPGSYHGGRRFDPCFRVYPILQKVRFTKYFRRTI
nr:MAG TPA: hypothetical protein [Caudoviricetes sp.]